MPPLPRVSVVVAARPGEPGLAACVEAVEAQAPFELLVETDVAGDGPAATRNRAAARATGEVLAFTDADCVPQPGWLDALARACGHGAGLVQGRVLPPDGAVVGPWDRFIWVAAEHGLYETANLAIRRDLFERLGGFESVLRPRADLDWEAGRPRLRRPGKELGEDVWLAYRCKRAGAHVAFAPDALVHHAVVPRGYPGWLAERARLRAFPELVRRVPELRATFLWKRAFLTRRSAAFDLALAGVVGRRPLLAAPYAAELARDVRRWGPRVAAGRALGDAAALAALAVGSVRARCAVL